MIVLWRRHHWTLLLAVVAAILGTGWLWREQAFADEKAKLLESKTVVLADTKLEDYAFEGTPRGQIALYLNGQTAGTRNFVVGQFRLKPGAEPHPIHKHPEEEVLIVASGQGEISCAGQTTKVGPGACMYTAPDAPHGIKNTGQEPLVFYFVKWTGVSRP